jgi:hypothetical protein
VVNPATAVVTAAESVPNPANLPNWPSLGVSVSGWRDLNSRPLTPRSAGIGVCIPSERECSRRSYRKQAFRDGQSRALGPDWAQVRTLNSFMHIRGPSTRVAS